jgi:hypothetical protein
MTDRGGWPAARFRWIPGRAHGTPLCDGGPRAAPDLTPARGCADMKKPMRQDAGSSARVLGSAVAALLVRPLAGRLLLSILILLAGVITPAPGG